MNRQQIFDTFIREVNGKGQAIRKNEYGVNECLYVLDGHPGCAIGCQPQFQEAYKECAPSEKQMNSNISAILEDNTIFATRLRELFEVQDNEDLYFLASLQRFHDDDFNWNGSSLKEDRVRYFCTRSKLRVESV